MKKANIPRPIWNRKAGSCRFSHCGANLPSFRFLLLLLPLLLLLLPSSASYASQIGEYRVLREPVVDAAGKVRLAIRSFTEDGVSHLLVVDPQSLQSYDLPASQFRVSASAASSLRSTPLLKAIKRFTAPPYRLQNGGAIKGMTPVDGVFLTVDLCPSHRPFEREMFETVESMARNGKRGQIVPVPVAVSISGIWLLKHPEEISYLKNEIASGRLAVTWVNHSFHHAYDPKAPLPKNFVLTPGTDFLKEVLDLEKALLAEGLVPSPFFRYPGLVSNEETMKRLRELSLIPIGSDAWLAKGESPRRGSFILVHGNGNEPKGVRLLLPMLKNRELLLLPLNEAFGREER